LVSASSRNLLACTSTVKTWLLTLRVDTLFNQWLTFCVASLNVTYVTEPQCVNQKALTKMATDLEGKVAFIAGAARGQGRAHAQRLAGLGVNAIHPAGVLSGTTMNDAMAKMNDAMAKMVGAGSTDLAQMQNALPVKIRTPDDIADAVEWLVSDRAKYFTGIQLPVDAGFTVRQ
jgi:hypothetical protein